MGLKISDILAHSTKPFASLEIVPPLKGVTKNELLDSIRPLMEFNPPYINVTCHRTEYEFVKESDGSFVRQKVSPRVSQSAVCASVQDEFDVEVVPHVICGGSDKVDILNQLEDFKFLGINNILALRGDSLAGEKRFTPTPGGYRYASELVGAIRSSRHSDEFCIGVGAYPEKHFEAPNLEQDIANLKRKVDQGADFIITQMFFDNKVFWDFCRKCTQAGITVPIIPGLKPLSTYRQVEALPELFSLDIPQDLVKELHSHREDKDACYRIGIEWCSAQCADLLAGGVPAVHFYTMGKAENIFEVLKRNF